MKINEVTESRFNVGDEVRIDFNGHPDHMSSGKVTKVRKDNGNGVDHTMVDVKLDRMQGTGGDTKTFWARQLSLEHPARQAPPDATKKLPLPWPPGGLPLPDGGIRRSTPGYNEDTDPYEESSQEEIVYRGRDKWGEVVVIKEVHNGNDIYSVHFVDKRHDKIVHQGHTLAGALVSLVGPQFRDTYRPMLTPWPNVIGYPKPTKFGSVYPGRI